MTRVLGCLALLLLSGCYVRTLHAPALCGDVRIDTVSTIFLNGQAAGVVTQETCLVWVAFSDSTQCWNRDGERLAQCP